MPASEALHCADAAPRTRTIPQRGSYQRGRGAGTPGQPTTQQHYSHHFEKKLMYNIAVAVGSLRSESLNRKLALALGRIGRETFAFKLLDIGSLPLYNEDLWKSPPAPVLQLKQDIAAADAVLFVCPEFNRSITAALKNTIDWGTRPWGQNSWAKKPGAIIGASPGNIGTAVAQAHLRSVLAICDMFLMGLPEVHLSAKPTSFNESGGFTDPAVEEFFRAFLVHFATWIGRFGPAPRD
jgi:chromate reductase